MEMVIVTTPACFPSILVVVIVADRCHRDRELDGPRNDPDKVAKKWCRVETGRKATDPLSQIFTTVSGSSGGQSHSWP